MLQLQSNASSFLHFHFSGLAVKSCLLAGWATLAYSPLRQNHHYIRFLATIATRKILGSKDWALFLEITIDDTLSTLYEDEEMNLIELLIICQVPAPDAISRQYLFSRGYIY